jgi:hypothetical protein
MVARAEAGQRTFERGGRSWLVLLVAVRRI